MAHLLMLEVPSENDFDLFETALAKGHRITFFTSNKLRYQQNETLVKFLCFAERLVEINLFDYRALENKAIEIHRADPFDALLCLIDTRIPEAAQLGERLRLRFVNFLSAINMQDKFTVRSILAGHSIAQPAFALASNNQELRLAIDKIGLPVTVKPSDNNGSQNIAMFLTEEDLNPLLDPLDTYLPCNTDYSFGVKPNDRLLVEQLVDGQLLGCDAFSRNGKHVLLGINEKLMFPPPSSATKGSCFPSDRYVIETVEAYVFSALNALGFDEGVTHTEILMSKNGPLLVAIYPRLVGAKTPRLLNLAFERSIHADVIDLYLGKPLEDFNYWIPSRFAVSRWITSQMPGILQEIVLPAVTDKGIRHIEILKKPGDIVAYPYQNRDRIGYVMAVGNTRKQAELLADSYIAAIDIKISSRWAELAAAH